ncbi:MAG: glycosyltransferase family 4 protein [Thermoplasmatota archaeon]
MERYAHGVLSRLAGRGHDVEAVAFTGQSAREEALDGVYVTRRRPPLRLGNMPVDLSFPGAVRAAIRDQKPDVVVAHTPVPFPAEMAYRAARKERVPFVVTYHAGRLQSGSLPLAAGAALDRWTWERRMLAGSSGLVAVSRYVRDHALRRHRNRACVIPPGVDLELMQPAPPDGNGILFVGPLSRSYRWKGVDVLWEAFAGVRRRLPDATLTLVGCGDRFLEFARKAARTDGVRVMDRLSDRALACQYSRAAVTVLPSTSDAEAFGMVLAEANACGRPVVASAVGGIPDFVRHGENGLLVRPGSAAALEERLVEVLTHPQAAQRMGARGRARVEREHNWDDLARATENVLARARTT